MYPKISSRLLSLIVCLSILCALLPPILAGAQSGTPLVNSGTRDQICTALSSQAESYYTGAYSYDSIASCEGLYSPNDAWLVTQGEGTVYERLHTLMNETQNVFPDYSGYGDNALATYWLKTDAEAGSSTYLYFYTDILSDTISATMNREHIWPKANASYNQKNGGADLHHLRPSISYVNSAKSNHRFADIADNAYGMTTSKVSGETVLQILKDAGQVEVRDNIKGDVARILLYVYCRWEQPNLYTDVVNSKLPAMDADDETNNGIRAIEDLDTLLRWCQSDPVDEWEMQRNDQTERIQGNRNVFIDYPEFAWLMFDLLPPADMATPSGRAAAKAFEIRVSVNDSSLGSARCSGNVITAYPNENSVLAGYRLLSGTASIVQDGNHFTVTASSDCTIQILFAPKPLYTLSFSDAAAITAYEGESILLPDAPQEPAGYRFLGWTLTDTVQSQQAPDFLSAGSSYTVTQSAAFYALYSYDESVPISDGDYVRVSEEPTDWSGDYLIVYEPLGYVFNGALSSPNVNTNCRMVSITDQRIPAASADPFRVSLTKKASGYSLRLASGVYIGNTSGYTGLAFGSTDSYSATLQYHDNGSISVTASSGAILGFQTAQRKFQFFTSGATTRSTIHLYRKVTEQTVTCYTTHPNRSCTHSAAYEIPVVSADCTRPGCAAYYRCDACGLCFADSSLQEVILPDTLAVPALGHLLSYEDFGTEHIVLCSRCDYSLLASHSYENGSCVCGAAEPVSVDSDIQILHSLNLSSDISINYVIPTSLLRSYDSFCLQCELPEYSGNIYTGSKTVLLHPVQNGNYYYFTLTGLTAVSMSNEIRATLRMEKSEASYRSETDVYGIAAYAYSQLDKSTASDELKALCAELLRYGSSAQVYKSYRTDSLADAAMTELQRSYLSDLSAVRFDEINQVLNDLEAPAVLWAGKSLNLGSKVVLRFVMNTANYEGRLEDLSLRIRFVNINGETETHVLTQCTPYSTSLPYYCFDFDGLLAAELRTEVQVAVYEGDTQLSQSLQYSASSYGSGKTGDLLTLCQALLAYSDTALSLFRSTT